MIKLLDLWEISKLPFIDVDGNKMNSKVIMENADRIVKSFEVDMHFNIIIELQEENED